MHDIIVMQTHYVVFWRSNLKSSIHLKVLILLLFLIVLTSCTTTRTEVDNTKLSETDNAFEVFKSQINSERWNEFHQDINYREIKDFLVDDRNDRNALSQAEIKTLLNGETKNKPILSYAEMEEDVDLYFRVLRSQWGAYYYWGGNEVFNEVREAIIEKYQSCETINTSDLTLTMHKALEFIKDGHFQIGTGKEAHFLQAEDIYWFFYSNDIFYLDEFGYYYDIEGQRYYYLGCDNEYVSIQRRLFADGTLAYGLVQFAPRKQIHSEDTITLSADNSEVIKTINWIESKPYSEDSLRNPDFKLLKSGATTFIQLRSFDERWKDQLVDFQSSGSKIRGTDLLLFDIRSNGGGRSKYFNDWFKAFTGSNVDDRRANARRTGALNESSSRNGESYRFSESQGTITSNSIPILVLVDNNCGSSGESALLGLRSLRNSIVIGTNSSGCATFGNVKNYVLPNSGIHFVYGTDLRCFSNHMENIDGKGFLPDIWCDPAMSVEAICNMIIKYGVVDGFDESFLFSDIKLRNGSTEISPGKEFSKNKSLFKMSVIVNGKVVTDYEYSVTNSIGTVSKMENGELTFKAAAKGTSTVTITYHGATASFIWRNWQN